MPTPDVLTWRSTTVTATVAESATARTLVFDGSEPSSHRAGQHVDLRLTASDGYQAARSYSVSSAPGEPLQITIERVDDGEVSPYLVDVVEVDDAIELRGPVGGYFVWDPAPTPLLLIGGGSGIAPLRSMWRAAPDPSMVSVYYSARTADRVIYGDELASRDHVTITLTRERHDGFAHGRLDLDLLVEQVAGGEPPATYVCGPTAFVETVLSRLAPHFDDPRSLRAERFG